MRLLDVDSVTKDRLPVFHELLENGSSSSTRYAILSHTWGQRDDYEDIVFDDIPSSETFARFLDEATQLKQWQRALSKKQAGFSKIANACRVARGMGLNYIWIDSCCIDKSKSAELNQSINSMFRWYKNSDWCIAYLEDLEPDGTLKQCRWFNRGWTLQEFVAPSKVTFYDKHWDLFGERSDARLRVSLSDITGIDMDCLRDEVNLASLSIAHKMSWAAGRDTTIPEDRAYSLLGGAKAFRRLQEEIARFSSDLSIFAWDPSSLANPDLDVFASIPDEFTGYEDMVPSYHSQHFTRTNKGIEMKTMLWRILCDDGEERLMLAIGKQKNGKPHIGIILRKLSQNVYIRRGNMRLFLDNQIISPTRRSTFYLVSPSAGTEYDHVLSTSRQLAVLVPLDGLGNFHTKRPIPEYAWDCEDRLFFNNRHWGGSDWRALELINKAPIPECDHRFVVLFRLKEGEPDCYLLRWKEDLGFMFDRRHQTETTMLDDEFRHVIQGKTNEIDMESTGAKLSILLIRTTTDEEDPRLQFRMEVREVQKDVPGSPASVKPTTAINESVDPRGREDNQDQVEAGPSHPLTLTRSASKMPPHSDGSLRNPSSRVPSPGLTDPRTHGQSTRVFSESQDTGAGFPGITVGKSALLIESANFNGDYSLHRADRWR